LEKKKEKGFLFAQRPLEEVFFSRIGPWPDFRAGEAAGGGIPAWGLTGDGGEVGEKLHGVERNPRVGSVGRGTAGGGGSAEQELRRRRLAAAVRWPGAAASGSGSTGGGQGS